MAGTKQTVSQRKTGKHLHREEVAPAQAGEKATEARRASRLERAEALQRGRDKVRDAAGGTKGLNAPSIVVHAEKLTVPAMQDAIGQLADSVENMARVAKDYFVDNQQSYRLVFVKNGKVIGFRLYPNSPSSFMDAAISFEDADFASLKQNIEKMKADGYYVVENAPHAKLADNKANVDEHIKIAKAVPGYLGGIILGLADEYGELNIKGESLADMRLGRESSAVSFKTKRIPAPSPVKMEDYDVLYTVLNEHQDMIEMPVTTPKQISVISSKIARAEKSVLLIYKKMEKVVGIQEVPQSLYMKGRTFDLYVEEQAKKYAASGLTAVVNKNKANAAVKTVKRTLEKTNLEMTLVAEDQHGNITPIAIE